MILEQLHVHTLYLVRLIFHVVYFSSLGSYFYILLSKYMYLHWKMCLILVKDENILSMKISQSTVHYR